MTSALLDPAVILGAEAIQNPYPVYARLQAAGPVHRIGDSDFYAVCRWDAVNEAVTRTDVFSSNLTATITYTPDRGLAAFPMEGVGGATHVLATADDPAHAVHRKMLLPQLAARRIRAVEPSVISTFDDYWAQGLSNGTIEWMGAVANRLPITVVTRLIGAPDSDIEALTAWAYAGAQLLDGLLTPDQLAVAGTSVIELSSYIADLLHRATGDPGDNLVGDLATALACGQVDPLTAQVIMVTLFSAGGESTASLLGTAVALLAADPDLQQRLRGEPDLVGAFLEEALRYEPPFRGHYRHVLRDTELAGVPLPADSRLLLLWGAANRDPAHFERPDEFLVNRPNSKGHLTFGKGAHFCVGAALARLEAIAVLRTLLERTSWIEATDIGPWLPSVLVRRRAHLGLTVR